MYHTPKQVYWLFAGWIPSLIGGIANCEKTAFMDADPHVLYRQRLRQFAIGWLIVLFAFLDLFAPALQFGMEASYSGLGEALVRAQFVLLCIWMFAGIDPLSHRLAAFVGGCSWLFLAYSVAPYRMSAGGVTMPGYWGRDLYFGTLATREIFFRGPVVLAIVGSGVLLIRKPWAATETGQRSASTLRWFQLSVSDFLVWSFVIGVLLLANPRSWDWLGDLGKEWVRALLLRDFAALAYLAEAIPTAIAALIASGLALGPKILQKRWVWISGTTLYGLLILELAFQRWVHLRHPLAMFRGPWPEVALLPMIGLVVYGAIKFVSLYDSLHHRLPTALAIAAQRNPRDRA